MNITKKRWNLLSVICLLLSVLLVASSCVVVDPNNEPIVTGQQTTGGNAETPTQGSGNGDNTPPVDPNKVTFTITLKDEENYAWNGVRVQICEKGESGKCSMPATTDETGKAVITIDKTVLDLNNSAIKIVKADGYVLTTNAIEIVPGETSKTITLSEYVVKADNFGEGVEGVAATVSLDNVAIATGSTNGDGEVKFLLETDDDYVITAVAPDGASLLDSTVSSWAFGENFNVTLSYIVIVRVDKTVTVVDENAQPVAGANVILVSATEEKDDQGNYIAAYSGTTDATGKVVFEGLNASSRYYIVVNDTALMAEGDNVWLDMGVTELTVTYSTVASANATYTVKVGYCDEEYNFFVLEGTYTIILVEFNDDLEEIEIGRYTTVNGVVSFEMPADAFFYASIDEDTLPEGYRVVFELVGFYENVAEFELEEIPESVPGDSAENPIYWQTGNMVGQPMETTQYLPELMMGVPVWYQLSLSSGMELVVQTNTFGAVICIEYNGEQYFTDNGTLTLTFTEPHPMMNQALFCVMLGGRLANMAEVTLTVRAAGAGGGSGNENPDNLPGSGTDNSPFILSEGGTYTAVVPAGGFSITPVIYEITILANGTLTVTGLGDNHWIDIRCVAKSLYPDGTNPEENKNTISQTVNMGEVWIIEVKTWDEQPGEVQFTVTLS